ncbi:Arylsulfotransferase-domain-containing protein [Xylaria sp. FL1777]|nr:Arylsulfotransferase-domain-containing protein [Xylaria sp. FL1777]
MQRLIVAIAVVATGVIIQQAIADANLIFDSEGYNGGRYGPSPHQYYHSTDIASPLLLVNHWDPIKTDNASYIFLTLDSPVDGNRAGPVIYRADDLSLVYSEPRWSVVHNAHIGQFNGKDYLVFLEAGKVGGDLSTNCLLYDSTYTLAYNVSSHGPKESSMGIHECQLTADGSAVVILKEIIPFNLTAVGGPEDGKVLDNIIQEIDIETDKLLWMWRGSDHYELSDSYMEYKHGSGGYDYIHMNSVERTIEGNFLISARHTHSIIFVDRESGNISWTLGGKNNDFIDASAGNATDFAWQHHARFNDGARTQLTMFDNHNLSSAIGCTLNCSRGKHVELDYEYYTARLISEFYHPESLVSGFEGSYQTLRGGNVFIGWGANPTFTEHTPLGECVLDVQFNLWSPENGYPINYRAFKMNWKAYPTWEPQIAALKAETDGQFRVYVSWNGATEVTKWQLLVGEYYNSVTKSAIMVPRAGFETEILLELDQPFMRAVALNQDSQILGMTAIIQPAVGRESTNAS